MTPITYRLAFIYTDHTEPYLNWQSDSYSVAHREAIIQMKQNAAVSTLIYSSKDTAIVLKRKWIPKESFADPIM